MTLEKLQKMTQAEAYKTLIGLCTVNCNTMGHDIGDWNLVFDCPVDQYGGYGNVGDNYVHVIPCFKTFGIPTYESWKRMPASKIKCWILYSPRAEFPKAFSVQELYDILIHTKDIIAKSDADKARCKRFGKTKAHTSERNMQIYRNWYKKLYGHFPEV